MKLLYLLRYWPTRSETFVAREIAELQRRGHEVIVAAIGTRADGAFADALPEVELWRPPRGVGRVRALADAETGFLFAADDQGSLRLYRTY